MHQESNARTQLDMLRKDKASKEDKVRKLYVEVPANRGVSLVGNGEKNFSRIKGDIQK